MSGFRGSPECERWRASLHRFYDPLPTVEHYEPVAMQGRRTAVDQGADDSTMMAAWLAPTPRA